MVSESVCKVFMLFLVWCSMGLYQEIPGPTMIDIKLIFNATYEEVSRSVSGRGAGGFSGAIVGGFLVQKFGHSLDLLVALAETVAAIAVMSVPYSLSVNTIWFHYFTIGCCGGVINIAGVRSAITLFPEKTAVCLQLLHVGYGVGALLVPLVVNPFLAVVEFTHPKPGGTQGETDTLTVLKETRVHTAFVAIGVGTLILSTAFYRYHFNRYCSKGYKQVPTKETQIDKNNSTSELTTNNVAVGNEQPCFKIFVLLLLFLYFYIMVGGEEVFGQFVRTFSLEVFNFTKTEASYLNMTFWLGLTIGRLVGSVVSNYVRIRKLFRIQVILHACSTTLLYMYAAKSSSMLWFCTIAEGFLVSPLYPCGIAYGNTLVEVSGFCLMVIQFAGSLGDLSFIWIAGKLYDTYGPKSLLVGLEAAGVTLVLCIILFRIVERFKIKTEQEMTIEVKS